MWRPLTAALLLGLAPVAAVSQPIADAARAQAQLIGNAMDTNDDQLISQNEMEMFGGTVLTLIDTDEDGKITRDEQAAFQLGMVEIADFRERRQAYDTAKAIVFDIFDRDSDGVISREEHMTGYRRAHSFADFDEDGQLSMSEYLNGFIFNIALRNALSQR